MRIPHLIQKDGGFYADNCTVVGDVTVGVDASIWYGTVVRGDVARIRIGARTNIQDLTMVHPQHDEDVEIGADVTIGHSAIVHGRVVGDGCLIGMGAILLDGSRIGAGSLIAAGALVPRGREIPPRSLVVGSPGKIIREVTDAELTGFAEGVRRYMDLARRHAGQPACL